MTAPDLPTRKYVVAPAAAGYRGTALWTVTEDGQLGEMVATEPQDHGPGSTAVADLNDALAVYRAACAVLAPGEATVRRVVTEICLHDGGPCIRCEQYTHAVLTALGGGTGAAS